MDAHAGHSNLQVTLPQRSGQNKINPKELTCCRAHFLVILIAGFADQIAAVSQTCQRRLIGANRCWQRELYGLEILTKRGGPQVFAFSTQLSSCSITLPRVFGVWAVA